MKKLLSVILAAALCLLPLCNAFAETAEPVLGGWTVCEDTTVTDEVKACFDAAFEGFAGSAVEPVALLATQVVAGVNYCFLAKVTPVVPDAVSHYSLVYIYHAVDGTDSLLGMQDLGMNEASGEETLAGGWTACEDPAITEEAQAALDAALEGYAGTGIAPVALLGTQVVAGVNYCFLAKVTPVVPNAKSNYAFVIVYHGVDGTNEVLNVINLELGL